MSLKNDIYPIKVVFRKWKNGTIDALMPYEDADHRGNCTVYSRIGQHSAADYSHCIAQTTPATPTEYKTLKRELESIGYVVTVIQKRTNK